MVDTIQTLPRVRRSALLIVGGLLACLTLASSARVSAQVATARAPAEPASSAAAIDKMFARWTTSTPGCAVGVAKDGQPVLSRAYGMANLEYGVANTPQTIFEAGSVAKQFTAAAVQLLARDGKLSLDDSVRTHVPELPDYGAPLTIRHLLTHTSGLRDWGSVAAIAGAPRTSRAYTHAHVLDIVSRQRALNFPSGTRYSYSNTGYNLAAIIVARVSGMSFAEFSRTRLFTPLGMTSTSWRDDHRRVVANRAAAYSDESGSFRTLMPFEDVHGNGGLLTTVGDLLKWNENFSSHVVGDAAFARTLETPGRFNNGRVHGYALGLTVGTRHGRREIAHSGSTAGYVAHLTRFPEQRMSVAVLCNVTSGGATLNAERVADLYLPPPTASVAIVSAAGTNAASFAEATGMFRDASTGAPLNVTAVTEGVRLGGGPIFVSRSPTLFVTVDGRRWEVSGATARLTDAYGTVVTYERAAAALRGVAALSSLTGTYTSDEAETEVRVVVEDDALVLRRRPGAVIRLTPLYQDAFSGSIGTVIFRRDGSGAVRELSVVQDRVWDLRFKKR